MLKILTQLLEAGEITQEVANKIDGDVSPEFSKLRDESAGWRVKYQDLNKSFESISKTKDDLEARLSNYDEQIAKAKEDGKSEVVKELETQKQEAQTLQSNLEAIQSENKSLKIETALNSGLSKYDVLDNDVVASYVKNLVELDGDSLKFKDGENVLTLDDGLKKFFESKPNLLKAQGNSGSGAGNSGHSGSAKSLKDLTLTEQGELFKTNPQEYERLKKQG